jgi:phenylacetate-CoA ligase
MSNNIRKRVFWLLDSLRGGVILKNYKEILQNDSQRRESHLNEILNYAVKHVPYYKGRTFNVLKDFPVMNKSVFKCEGVNCISDEFPHYKKLHTVRTSGSTGTPLTVYLDPRKRRRVIADLLVINDKIGWNLGEHYVFLRNWMSNKRQSVVERIAKNFYAVSVGDFDDNNKEKLYKHFLRHKNSIFVGYSSSVCDFMDWMTRNRIGGGKIQLKLIHCSAEDLYENKRKALRDCFCCPVYNRYSNEEVGLIAMMSDDSNVFEVNTASLRMELLKLDSDDYVKPGEIGRVVLTDLFNRAMPLIRYDIGDLAISYDSSDDVKSIVKLCGRSADVLHAPGGVLIGNTTASAAAEVFECILKWQLAQVSEKKFEFRYVGKLSEKEKSELRERLLISLGKQTECEIIEKASLPLNKNGKFKTIINETSNR